MKFYKVKKSQLKWCNMQQVAYNWKLPILVDNEMTVLAGNSIKDKLNDDIIVIIVNKWDIMQEALFEMEEALSKEENWKYWYDSAERKLRRYFEIERKGDNQLSLFDYKNYEMITEENYIKPKAYDFEKHNVKSHNENVEEVDIDLSILEEGGLI